MRRIVEKCRGVRLLQCHHMAQACGRCGVISAGAAVRAPPYLVGNDASGDARIGTRRISLLVSSVAMLLQGASVFRIHANQGSRGVFGRNDEPRVAFPCSILSFLMTEVAQEMVRQPLVDQACCRHRPVRTMPACEGCPRRLVGCRQVRSWVRCPIKSPHNHASRPKIAARAARCKSVSDPLLRTNVGLMARARRCLRAC